MKPLRQQLRYSYDRSQTRGAGGYICTMPSRRESIRYQSDTHAQDGGTILDETQSPR
jgi:hypothetical protein